MLFRSIGGEFPSDGRRLGREIELSTYWAGAVEIAELRIDLWILYENA